MGGTSNALPRGGTGDAHRDSPPPVVTLPQQVSSGRPCVRGTGTSTGTATPTTGRRRDTQGRGAPSEQGDSVEAEEGRDGTLLTELGKLLEERNAVQVGKLRQLYPVRELLRNLRRAQQ